MKNLRTIWTFVAATVLIPISVFAITSWYENRFIALPVLGSSGHHTGRFHFIDQDNKAFTDQTWTNNVVVANFFFTHCVSVCPKMMYQLQRVQAYAPKDVIISSFTVDPQSDSAARLKHYAAKLGVGDNWRLITGEKKELYRFARKDLLLVATDGDGGPDDFIHSEKLVLIDRKGRIRGFYDGLSEKEVNELIHDLKKIEDNSE